MNILIIIIVIFLILLYIFSCIISYIFINNKLSKEDEKLEGINESKHKRLNKNELLFISLFISIFYGFIITPILIGMYLCERKCLN